MLISLEYGISREVKSRIYQRVDQIADPAATAKLGEMYVGNIHMRRSSRTESSASGDPRTAGIG
jgi:hypothetical protein